MKYKSLLLGGLLCICLGLIACGKDDKQSQIPTATSSGDVIEQARQEAREEQGYAEEENQQPSEEETQKNIPDISFAGLKAEKEQDWQVKLLEGEWTSCTFCLGGIKYQLPFSYARISDKWTYDSSQYEDFDENFVLKPGQRTSTNIVLTNPNVNYTFTVGFYNPYDVDVTIAESMVYSFGIDLQHSLKKPTLILPSKLTWNSSISDAVLTYHVPEDPYVHDEELHTFTYNYEDMHTHYMSLVFGEEEIGLIGFTMTNYDNRQNIQKSK